MTTTAMPPTTAAAASTPSSSSMAITKDNVTQLSYFELLGLVDVGTPLSSALIESLLPRLAAAETTNAIRRVYRKLSIKFHPDKDASPDARAAFERLKLALDTLTDEAARRAYAASLSATVAEADASAASSAMPFVANARADRAAAELARREQAQREQQRASLDALWEHRSELAFGVGGSAGALLSSLRRQTMTSLEQLYEDAVVAWEVDADILAMKEAELDRLFRDAARLGEKRRRGIDAVDDGGAALR